MHAAGVPEARRMATTPPIDWATTSQPPAPAAAAAPRTRSSNPRTAGSCVWAPAPGQPRRIFAQSAGRRSATGPQKPGSPVDPGRKTTRRPAPRVGVIDEKLTI